nr:uncharacterized protein LOC128687784 [Cherax quadricarinatus]
MKRLRPLLIQCVILLVLTSSLAVNHTRYKQETIKSFNDDSSARVDLGGWINVSQTTDRRDASDDTVGGDDGVLGALWQKVRPYVTGEEKLNPGGRVANLKKRLLTEADELVALYTNSAHNHLRERAHSEVVRAVSEGRSGQPWTESQHHKRSLYRDSAGATVLSAVEGAVSLGVRGSQSVHMTVWHDKLIVALVSNTVEVSLYTVDQNTLEVQRSPGPRGKCEFGHFPGDGLLLVCITVGKQDHSRDGNGCHYAAEGDVAVYLVQEAAPGQGALHLHLLQAIPTSSPSYVHLWIHSQKSYLMVASEEGTSKSSTTSTTYHTTSRLYQWMGLYFDVLQELPATSPRAVHHFMINNFSFLAVANFKNNKGQHNCHSLVYRYSVDKDRYVPFQQVSTRGATHFQSFTLGTGHVKDTFLAVANFCEDDSVGCNLHTSSTIYKFQTGKFILFQEIATTAAVQWMAVQVEATVLLSVVSSIVGVKFYQYNGWRFVPTTLQYSNGPLGVGVTGIASVTWNKKIIIGVSNEDDSKTFGAPTLYTISFKTEKSLNEYYMATEKWCKKLRSHLARENLGSLYDKVEAAPKTTQSYTFTRPIVVEGNLTVMKASQALQVYTRLTDEWLPMNFRKLEMKREIVQQMLDTGRSRLSETITLAGPVTWPTDLHFDDLITDTYTISSVGNLTVNWISDQQLPHEKYFILLTGQSPLHLKSLHFSHLHLQSAVMVEMLGSVTVSSYVTLSGQHTITGEKNFLGLVNSSQVLVDTTIDGLQVDPLTLLLTTSSQTHTGLVSCTDLDAVAVKISSINNVNINQLFQHLVTRDSATAIAGQIRIRNDLFFSGNLEVNITANIDLLNPLRTDEPRLQVLSGHHRVGGVKCRSTRVAGKINGVDVPAEVFLSWSNAIYGLSSAAFTQLDADSITINTALHTIKVSMHIPSTSAELTTSADLVRPFSTVSEAIASTEEVVVSFTPEQTTVSNVVGLTDFPINRSGLLGVNSRSSDAFWTVPGRKEEKVTIADTLKLLEELKILWQGMVQKSGKSSASRDVQETLISSGKVDAIISILKHYIRDIGNSSATEVRAVVSKWNLSDLVYEFITMENMLYDNPELITAEIEVKINNIHTLIDEVEGIIEAFEEKSNSKLEPPDLKGITKVDSSLLLTGSNATAYANLTRKVKNKVSTQKLREKKIKGSMTTVDSSLQQTSKVPLTIETPALYIPATSDQSTKEIHTIDSELDATTLGLATDKINELHLSTDLLPLSEDPSVFSFLEEPDDFFVGDYNSLNVHDNLPKTAFFKNS